MKKTLFNLEDGIVRDSLDSLATLEEDPVIVGGVCVQLHARGIPDYLRNTSDIDLITPEKTEYSSFMTNTYPFVSDNLKKKGYKIQPKNGRINNSIIVLKDPNREYENKFLIHFTKPGENIMSVLGEYIQQEMLMSEKIEYDPKRKPVRVLSLEEALPLKLRRSIIFGNNRESIVGPIYSSLVRKAIDSEWGYLAKQPMKEWIGTLNRIQEESQKTRNKNIEQTYKLSKDIYDICLSAKIIADEMVEFDKNRYERNNSKILKDMEYK